MIAISTNIHQVTSVRGEHHESGGTKWFNLWITTAWGQKVEITLFHDEAHEEFFERLEGALKSLEPRPHMARLGKFVQSGPQAQIQRGVKGFRPASARMIRVIIESPYAASDTYSVAENVAYARSCMLDAIKRGEAPLASHLLYTQEGILDDRDPNERALGIAAGLAWMEQAQLVAFYVDHSWSTGMLGALGRARALGVPVEARSLKGRLPSPQELPR